MNLRLLIALMALFSFAFAAQTPRAGVVAGAAFAASAFFGAIFGSHIAFTAVRGINPLAAQPPMACRVVELVHTKAADLLPSFPPSPPFFGEQQATATAADIARAGLFNIDDSAADTQEEPAVELPNLTTCIGLGLMICAIFFVWRDGRRTTAHTRNTVEQCNADIHNLEGLIDAVKNQADSIHSSVMTLSELSTARDGLTKELFGTVTQYTEKVDSVVQQIGDTVTNINTDINSIRANLPP
ncbi:hypothetical protein H4R19_002120 [Coemansia spiralis]|nr:hypothetical protein H4R19_002120 [Coemansia spiralis]